MKGKKQIIWLILLFSIFTFSCKEKRKIDDELEIIVEGCNTYKIIPNSFSYYKIPYHIADSIILKNLNKIIEDEKQCPCYDSLLTAFVIKVSNNKEKIEISIFPINIFCYFYYDVYGVFKYEKHYFFLQGEKFQQLFTPGNKCLKIKSLIPIQNYDIIDIHSNWNFYITNSNDIVFDGHFPCPKWVKKNKNSFVK